MALDAQRTVLSRGHVRLHTVLILLLFRLRALSLLLAVTSPHTQIIYSRTPPRATSDIRKIYDARTICPANLENDLTRFVMCDVCPSNEIATRVTSRSGKIDDGVLLGQETRSMSSAEGGASSDWKRVFLLKTCTFRSYGFNVGALFDHILQQREAPLSDAYRIIEE